MILVDDAGRAKPQFEALPNSNIDPTAKKNLVTALLGESDDPLLIPTLATETAETAARAAARVAAIMSGSVRDVVGKDRKESTFTAPAFLSGPLPFFTIGDVEVEARVWIQGDPFSAYLGDGRALIWVWRLCGSLRNDEKSIRAITSQPHPSDVYFYADNRNEEWICRRLRELSLDTVKAEGYVREFSLGRPLAVSDRSRKGIRDDLRELITWARKA